MSNALTNDTDATLLSRFKAVLKMETARAALRVQTAEVVATAREKRRNLLQEALEARGESIPELNSSSSKSSGAASSAEPSNLGADAFKKRMVTKVESLLPPAEESGPGRRIAGEMLRDSVSEVPLVNEQGEGDMSVQLIAGVAKQAGVGWEEMERLMELVEKDAEKREELREVVREAMFNEDQRTQDEAQRTGS